MQGDPTGPTSTAVAPQSTQSPLLHRKTNSIEWLQLEIKLVADGPGGVAESEAAVTYMGAVGEADFAASDARVVDTRHRGECRNTRVPTRGGAP